MLKKIKFLKIRESFFKNSQKFFLPFLQSKTKRTFSQFKKKMGAKRPKSLERRAEAPWISSNVNIVCVQPCFVIQLNLGFILQSSLLFYIMLLGNLEKYCIFRFQRIINESLNSILFFEINSNKRLQEYREQYLKCFSFLMC